MRRGESRIRRQYGLNSDDLDAALESVGFVCAICEREEPRKREGGSGVSLAIDHDHVTGKPGLLLCSNCNLGLGHFRDDPQLLEKAAEYLRLHRPKLS